MCRSCAILAGRARPSAGIGVVEVKKLEFLATVRARPSAGIVGVKSLLLWSRANLRGSRATLCGDCACQIGLAVVPHESSHTVCRDQAAKSQLFKYKSSTRTSPQLRLQSRNF